jgi:hypothetical protein
MRASSQLPAPLHLRTAETIERLNLNIARLRRNRAEVIALLRAEFQKKAPKLGRVKALLELASSPDATDRLTPYCQVAVFYLAKKLRQLGP